MCLEIACGIVTALDSNWTYFFPCPNNSPTSLCQKLQGAFVLSSFNRLLQFLPLTY